MTHPDFVHSLTVERDSEGNLTRLTMFHPRGYIAEFLPQKQNGEIAYLRKNYIPPQRIHYKRWDMPLIGAPEWEPASSEEYMVSRADIRTHASYVVCGLLLEGKTIDQIPGLTLVKGNLYEDTATGSDSFRTLGNFVYEEVLRSKK